MRTWLNMKCGDLLVIIQQKSRQAGLTLVELMMVVAIIGVLAAIAIPAYDDYVEEARVAQAVSEIGYMSAQIEAYWNDERVYPDGLADIGAAGMLDPWGNPYQYLKLFGEEGNGGSRKDRKLNPLNSDFDLYSMGKDGQSKTQISNRVSLDDVIRASDGKFIHLASKY